MDRSEKGHPRTPTTIRIPRRHPQSATVRQHPQHRRRDRSRPVRRSSPHGGAPPSHDTPQATQDAKQRSHRLFAQSSHASLVAPRGVDRQRRLRRGDLLRYRHGYAVGTGDAPRLRGSRDRQRSDASREAANGGRDALPAHCTSDRRDDASLAFGLSRSHGRSRGIGSRLPCIHESAVILAYVHDDRRIDDWRDALVARRRSLCLAWSETCSRSGASTRRVSERTWVAGSFLPPDLRRCSSCPHGGVSSQQHGGRPGPPMTVDARPNYRGSGDAAAYGLDGCLDAVLEVEFREDAGDVVVDGVGAERELVRDLAIGSAAG